MSAEILRDADARRAATSEFGANLVVLAGAGTGKTGLLVERMLVALGAGLVTIDRLAAITFTEKAAAEMKARLALGLERLRHLASGAEAPEPRHPADRAFVHLTREREVSPREIAERGLSALTGLDRASVGTIHNFCSDLLHAHPVEARVDPGFAIDPGERFHALFDEEWDAFLAEEVGPRARRAELWRFVLERVRPKALREVGRALAGFEVPEAALLPPFTSTDPRALFRDEAEALVARAERILAVPVELTPTNVQFFECVRLGLRAFLEGGLEPLRSFFEREPARRERIDRATHAGTGLRSVSKADFKAAVHDAKHLILGLLGIDEELAVAVLEGIAPFARKLRETYLAQGLVGFDGLLSLARDLLRDHEDVREEAKRRIRMLLVDEFQDTDPIQYEIVLFLAERTGGAARDAYRADLEPGRLFVVGDPKQSIYRFRGADYAAFRNAVERIVACGGRTLDLRTNFRSEPAILLALNRLFEDPRLATWQESETQPAYVPIQARPGTAAGAGGVEAWTVEVQRDARAGDRREAEGKALARAMRRWVEEEGLCSYGEITVLLRAFTPLADYLRPLREAGIPFIVDGGREFLKRPEVGHLLAALRAVALPSDPVALLAYLRSPAGGVTDGEMAAFAAAGGTFRYGSPIDAVRFPGIAAAFETLRSLADEARNLPPDAIVRRVLAGTDLLPLSASAFEGAQRVANLRKLAAIAADLARDGKLSLLEVVDALERGYLTEIDSDSPLADEGTDAVRLMTIHKAKGLENRVVVLADLSRTERPRGIDSSAPVRVARTEHGPRIALTLAGKTNAERVLQDRLEERHTAAEDIRILYVALTRARERLVVLAGQTPQARGGASSWTRALAAWGYEPDRPLEDRAPLCDGLVLHRLLPALPVEKARPEAPGEDSARAVIAYREAREALLAASTPHLAVPSSLKEETGGERAAPLPSAVLGRGRSVAKAAGTVLHRWLEGLRSVGSREALASLDGLAESAAREEGADLELVAREAGKIAEAFLASPLAERFRKARIRGREVPILLQREHTTWWGSLDLLYADEAGRPVVVDFKTDRDSDPEILIERYREQVSVYREAVRVALGLERPPRVELWLLRHGTIVEV